ncbi:MarR family winged helix-turn-helix transcriptional regulator [Rhizobium sp. S152]|uniref:MarR family winged helix-turn-helix transcriptional regulator n=1 Tax=Rhizobium sp. S152 TaxID=3055038 RepID=UPI0025A9BA05|nr:MarR family winged helix-turn-helix transcriptional regulator [Rhizobium sp. S152]MDM9628485.1 MarR family winged helix-turn-helix transcriptional regulator [Rhizobium sp. S152]
MTRIYDSKLAPMGLKSTQRTLLLHIAARPGITITKLSALTLVDKSALKRNLGPMQRQGYVTINVSPEDARSRSLAVTAKGQDLLSKSRRAWLEAQELYEDSVGIDDALEIKTLMRLVANISEPGVERTGVKT